MTSDTAILAQASNAGRMLDELIVREVLCKPAVLTISRREQSEKSPAQMTLEMKPDPAALLESAEPKSPKMLPKLEEKKEP
jgi:hypothetical protein